MSAQTLVDPEKLVRSGTVLRGEFALSALPELADRLFSQEGVVQWELSGGHDLHERPRLVLGLQADLLVSCQRCLQPMTFRLQHRHALVVVPDDAALPDLEEEEDDADCIVLEGPLDLRELVQEELLLALPMMPRHEQADCHSPPEEPSVGAQEPGHVQGALSQGGGETRVSPFAVLQKLSKS